MRILKHFSVVFALAVVMTAYLYSYKPRDYTSVELFGNLAFNTFLWVVLLGVPYTLLVLAFSFLRRWLSEL